MPNLLQAIRFLYGLRAEPEVRQGGHEDDAEREAGSAPGEDAGGGPEGSSAWIHWLVPAGLGLGVLLALLTSLGWRLLTLRPTVAGLWVAVLPTLLVYWLGPGTARYVGLGRTWAGLRLNGESGTDDRRAPADPQRLGLIVLAMLAAGVTQYVCIAVLPTAMPMFDGWPDWLNRALFPSCLYGGLVLMGAWGSAAVMLSASLGRPDGGASPAVRQLLAAPSWSKIIWGLGPPAGLTILFLAGWMRTQPSWEYDWAQLLAKAGAYALIVAAVLFCVTMLFSWFLARRGRGHDRASLLAAGLIGETVLLILLHVLVK